jgi:hypothetical protein
MSGKITVQCELRDKLILKDTLEKMGLSFTEKDGVISVTNIRYEMTITDESIKCDTIDNYRAEEIKWKYQQNLQERNLVLSGSQYQISETSEEYIINVYN